MKSAILSRILVGIAACAGMGIAAESELLARNTVVAQYENTVERPCRFMTADCPDRCDHATRVAIFRVLKNEDYAKLGEYGDDKMQEGGNLAIDILKDEAGQAPEVRQLISSLKQGDRVRMTIHHNYVKDETANYPARPVVNIERLAPSGSDIHNAQKP